MDEQKLIDSLIELAVYVMDYRQSIFASTDNISDEAKEQIISNFNREKREETINYLLSK